MGHFPEQIRCRGRRVTPELHSARRATSPSKYFVGTNRTYVQRQPRNYFLQDVPPPRAKTLSGTKRHPGNYFLQTVPPPRSNALLGTERQPWNYFLHDVPPPQTNTFSVMELPRAHTLSGTERQPQNYFLQDVPPPRANTLSGTEVYQARADTPSVAPHNAISNQWRLCLIFSQPSQVQRIPRCEYNRMKRTRSAPLTRGDSVVTCATRE